MAKAKRQKGAMKRTEFRFVMSAFTPATIPLARLGTYLSELASLLGEEKSVHLREVIEGSTVPVLEVEHEAVPKVRARLESAKTDTAGEPYRQVRSINRMLREDNATGRLMEARVRRPVLDFPGRLELMERAIVTHRFGTIEGKLVRIGGTDQTIHAILMSEGQPITSIEMSATVAKHLSPKLFEVVRLVGNGKWERDGEGHWSLKRFRVDRTEELVDAPLSQALNELRQVGLGWNDETAIEELKGLREGGATDEGD